MKICEIIRDKYKLRIPPTVYYELLADVHEAEYEQEPILDKIRAEIDMARFVDKDTRICKNALSSGLEVAMQIIDKYKAESEDKE